MKYTEVVEIVKNKKLEMFKGDINCIYVAANIESFYSGTDWYIGILKYYEELYVYVREMHSQPDNIFRWLGNINEFDECLDSAHDRTNAYDDYSGRCDYIVINNIMSRYPEIDIGKKFGLR